MARWQLMGLAFLVVAGYCLQDWCVGDESKPGPLDPSRSETWEPAIARTERQRTEMAKALMSVAQDEKRHPDDRHKAIRLLARIGSKESLGFLAANVGLRVPARVHRTMRDELPCYKVLSKGDWSTASAILRSLKGERSDRELRYLAGAVPMIFGTRMARAAVDLELSRIEGVSGEAASRHRRNLTKLKGLLE